ncbi:hypothetical protein [Lysinibacillus boronitolerans]|uniref:hypothetical protein n=1 Tax=Lysinibacillus boronitolerans TaxID=309788 RepID=UPI0002D929E4|nr:hypothetical protein [Lysinibacillus boronitolerans]
MRSIRYKIDNLSDVEIALIAGAFISSYKYDLADLEIPSKEWNNAVVKMQMVAQKHSEEALQKQIDELVVKIMKNLNKPTPSKESEGIEGGKTISINDFNARRK